MGCGESSQKEDPSQLPSMGPPPDSYNKKAQNENKQNLIENQQEPVVTREQKIEEKEENESNEEDSEKSDDDNNDLYVTRINQPKGKYIQSDQTYDD